MQALCLLRSGGLKKKTENTSLTLGLGPLNQAGNKEETDFSEFYLRTQVYLSMLY